MLRNPGLSACLVVGIAVTVAIAAGVPMYSSTINSRMLVEELQAEGRPPYSFMFRYLGSNSGEIEWKELARLDEYLFANAPSLIGLPDLLAVRYLATDYFRVFPAGGTSYESPEQLLDWTSVGFVSGLEAHIDIVEGRFPGYSSAGEATRPADSEVPPAIEVLVSQERAEKLGLQLGEAYILVRDQKDARTGATSKIELTARITGIWVPRDERETYWFYAPDTFDDTFICSEAAFQEVITTALGKSRYNGLWYFILDGSDLKIEDTPRVLENIRYLKARIASYNTAVSMVVSPDEALKKYRRAAFNLAILLYVFSIPVLALILYFIVLISSMVVERQSNEIALLRSRGSSSLQIVNMYLLENLLLGLIGTLLGLAVGRLLARVMGATESFLKFSFRDPVRVRESWLILVFALAAAAVSVFAILLPVFSAAKHTIVSYKQERARSLRKPLWQRYFIDCLLLLPLAYGFYTLWRRGTIALVEGSNISSDPFSNPILFLVPTLFVITLALLFLRFFPVLMELVSRLSERLKGAALLLAARSLSRSPSHYLGPLLLLILTTGLASFTASMARTLDSHIVDRAYYEAGGDFRLVERGELIGEEYSGPGLGAITSEQQKAFIEEPEEEPHWEFIPVFEYANLPGVRQALRVGNYKVLVRWSDSAREAQIVGVDPKDFQRPLSYRSDYAPYPLGLLLAVLDRQQSALIVDRRFFRQNNLRLG
ncbi:MAG TPA: FtsX-like permease family protein, partial [Spirochaetia bacterium]|nr:FtsX-like permease family protein [Spirochaetia bacterium]